MSDQFRPPFPEIIPATFIDRPNRFILHCRLADGQRVRAFLPNPGRLQELLLPDVAVFLVPAEEKPGRKTAYTAIGIAGEHHPVFLHTHITNAVARHLIESGKIPGFRRARILRAEAPLGHSRFDFLLSHRGEEVYLEVKSCTLFGNRVAMFPDAVTDRGRRHLEELAALSQAGTRTAVLFVVHSDQVDWFMPDYHTDPAFSQTLLDVREHVRILPMAVSWSPDFSLSTDCRLLKIPWQHVSRELGDRGNYLIVGRLTGTTRSRLGSDFCLAAGWCSDGLVKHLRGLRKAGNLAPLVPELGEGISIQEVFPICASRNQLTAIADALQETCPPVSVDNVPGKPPVRFFTSATHPCEHRRFHQILARFRMAPPASQNEIR